MENLDATPSLSSMTCINDPSLHDLNTHLYSFEVSRNVSFGQRPLPRLQVPEEDPLTPSDGSSSFLLGETEEEEEEIKSFATTMAFFVDQVRSHARKEPFLSADRKSVV